MNNKDNDEFVSSNKLFPNFKKISLNHIKNLFCIRKNLKSLRIDDNNSKNILNQINAGNNLTTKYINSKNDTLDENYNKMNINTEKIFPSKELALNRNEQLIKEKILNKRNIIEKKSLVKLRKNTHSPKSNKNNTPNKNRITNNYNRNKFNKLLMRTSVNSSEIFKKINTIYKIKKNNISKTSRNKDSPTFFKNKNNNIISILNKRNDKSLINAIKSRNNIKSFCDKEETRNKISKNSQISIYKNNVDSYFKKKSTIYQNYSSESKIIMDSKSKTKKMKQIEYLSLFKSDNNIINKNKDKNFKLKSEPKKMILKKRKGKNKFVFNNAIRIIKTEESKNVIIKKIKYYNLKNIKNSDIIQKNYTKRSNYTKKEKINIRSKTNNNSIININSFSKKQNYRKDVKSSDISILKPKKKKKKIHKKFPLELINKKKLLERNLNRVGDDNNYKKIIGVSKNIKNYFNNKKKKIITTDLHAYNFDDDKYYNNIL
jgi:hypothetical protein